jgi:hypothetical protein
MFNRPWAPNGPSDNKTSDSCRRPWRLFQHDINSTINGKHPDGVMQVKRNTIDVRLLVDCDCFDFALPSQTCSKTLCFVVLAWRLAACGSEQFIANQGVTPGKTGHGALSNPLPTDPRHFCCVGRLKAMVSHFEGQRNDKFSATLEVSAIGVSPSGGLSEVGSRA